MPHFQADKRVKYSLEALHLQFQVNAILSPNLAHQVKWHRFVNTKGGPGNNIPCDLHNEHVNKLIKGIIGNMGSNLTEGALQHAVHAVSTLDAIGKKFDVESDVAATTTAHSTKSDDSDVKKVVSVLLRERILEKSKEEQEEQERNHRAFAEIHFNPLHKWDAKKTREWIEKKKKEFTKYGNKFRSQEESDDED